MRRAVVFLLLAVLLLSACGTTEEEERPPIEPVGKWCADELPEYVFELKADESCVMLSENGEWLSAGTYEVYDDHIAFTMDTGEFTWVREEDTDALVFEAGGMICHYRKEQ